MKPIYSDDPKAVEKLKEKIAQLEAYQTHMKEINKGYRKHGIEWVKDKVSAEIFSFYWRGTQYIWNKNKFYPTWALTNNSATIRQSKKRLSQLDK
jgi:hypothetical protein